MISSSFDDFHYMDRSVQEEVAKGIKEAARLGINIVTAQVPHRGDDVVRANPELRGRVRAIDINYWDEGELERIADLGFDALNARLSEESIEELVKESAGSPQLICLHTCFVLNIRESKSTTEDLEMGANRLKRFSSRRLPLLISDHWLMYLIAVSKDEGQREMFISLQTMKRAMCTVASFMR